MFVRQHYFVLFYRGWDKQVLNSLELQLMHQQWLMEVATWALESPSTHSTMIGEHFVPGWQNASLRCTMKRKPNDSNPRGKVYNLEKGIALAWAHIPQGEHYFVILNLTPLAMITSTDNDPVSTRSVATPRARAYLIMTQITLYAGLKGSTKRILRWRERQVLFLGEIMPKNTFTSDRAILCSWLKRTTAHILCRR